MKTFLKVIGIIIGVIIVALGGFAIYAKNWWDNLTIKPDIQGIKAKLPSIIANILTTQKIPVVVLVDNDNSTGITIKNFQIKGAYQGTNVFQSNVIPIIAIPANAKNFPVSGELQVFASINTGKLAAELLKNNAPTIQMTISVEKFGISKDFTFDYTIK